MSKRKTGRFKRHDIHRELERAQTSRTSKPPAGPLALPKLGKLKVPKFQPLKIPRGPQPGGRVPASGIGAKPAPPSPLELVHPTLPPLELPSIEHPPLPDLAGGHEPDRPKLGPLALPRRPPPPVIRRTYRGEPVEIEPISEEEYAEKYGQPRNVSPGIGESEGMRFGAVKVLIGPTPLNHEGHLRATGKKCGHWAMYAYLLKVGRVLTLGIQFQRGFRAYYPALGEADYHAIVNSESGSYWCWDQGIRPGGIPYVRF